MAWTRRATGTASNGNNGTSLTPGLPSGWQAGDLHLCHFQCYGGTNSRTPSMTSDWTSIGNWTNGTAKHALWYRIAVGGDTAPTITLTGTGVTGDTQLSQIHGFYPGAGKTAAIAVTGSTSTNASADDVGPITGITATAGHLGIISCGKANDWNGAPTLTGWTASVNTAANESTTGNDASQALMYVLSIAGGATGNLTVVDNGGTASAGVGLGIMVTFKEIIAKATGLSAETDTPLQLGKAKASGLSSETDTALTLNKAVVRATGLSEETDTALTLTGFNVIRAGFFPPLQFSWGGKEALIRATGLASETDTSIQVGRSKGTGRADETDSSFTAALVKARTPGRADETDTAFARGKAKATGRADETDIAFARGKAKATGLSSETDTAFARGKAKATGRADETDTAYKIPQGKSVGLASETDTAFDSVKSKIYSYGFSEDISSAFELSIAGAGPVLVDVGLSEETDTSYSLTRFSMGLYLPFGFKWGYSLTVKIAIETDTAFSIPVAGGSVGFFLPLRYAIGNRANLLPMQINSETDTAIALNRYLGTRTFEYEIAGEEYDVYSLVPKKFRTPGLAVEVNEAVALSVRITEVFVSLSSTVDYSLELRIARKRAVEVATETDTALKINRGIGRFIPVSIEYDSAYSLAINAIVVPIGYAAETNVSFALIGIKSKYTQTCVEVDTAQTLVLGRVVPTTVYAWMRVQ